MILVAGGSGRLGSLVVRRLANRGLEVRVLTRERARAAYLVGERIHAVQGDVRSRGDVASAMAGVETVVSAVHGFAGPGDVTPASVDRDGNATLIDAAAREGASVVLMSIVGAAADSPMELFRMKHAAEQHLRSTGTPATTVRATAFLELWIDLLVETAGRSGRPLVFGRGNNPINFVSTRDVAALVEVAVTDRATRGTTLEIGGPENLTFDQLATLVQGAAGRSTKPRHVPRSLLHLMAALTRGIKPELSRQARAALVFDTADMTFDSSAIRRRYPGLPCTTAAQLLSGLATKMADSPEVRNR